MQRTKEEISEKKMSYMRLSIMLLILLLEGVYLMVSLYYRDGFSLGTYINGIYCTGKSVEEVNRELVSRLDGERFFVTDVSGRRFSFALSDIGFRADYTGALAAVQARQNAFLWPLNLFGAPQKEVVPEVICDEDALEDRLRTACGDSGEEAGVRIVWSDAEGYCLADGKLGVMDLEAAKDTVLEALGEGVTDIDLSGCVKDLPYSEEELEIFALYDKICRFTECGIVYDMGDKMVRLTPEVTGRFILLDAVGGFVLDARGELMLDRSGVEAFVNALCDVYDTYGRPHSFHTTSGLDIVVAGGTYGSQIDREAEVEYLVRAFSEKAVEEHVPAYLRQAYVRGADDIGDTYIEVNMTQQKLYFYQGGELKLETDVVTGNISRRMDTPEGVNYIYNMQRNRVLRGQGYSSPVKFWLPVAGNIGLHDSTWRKEYGGDIYKTDGSHGCVNVPLDAMRELYGMVEIGIPVVMFFEPSGEQASN